MPIPVFGFGAGGHAKVVIEILRLDGRYEPVGLLDPKGELHGSSLLDVPILGGDEQAEALKARGIEHFFVGAGSAPDPALRIRLYESAVAWGLVPVAALHPSAAVSGSASLGRGATVMAMAVVNASAALGENVILNTGCVVEHDCVIGDHVHVAPAACLGGNVRVGNRAHVGAGSVVRQGIRVGSNAIVGAGAVVVKDVPDGRTVIGNPARPFERQQP